MAPRLALLTPFAHPSVRGNSVTVTRIVEPTSPLVGVYVEPVAPETAEQLLPALSQRFH